MVGAGLKPAPTIEVDAMPILLDPEVHESDALFNLPVAWTEASVLEIGSGDGRLTWRYADKVARVVAIEPDVDKHKLALSNRPRGFEHVDFFNLGLDEFVENNKEKFNLALLSWSL
jgi:hypothetical protein